MDSISHVQTFKNKKKNTQSLLLNTNSDYTLQNYYKVRKYFVGKVKIFEQTQTNYKNQSALTLKIC